MLAGLGAVALVGLFAFAIFVWNPFNEGSFAGSFNGRDILLFGILPVLVIFSVGFWAMLRRESKRLSK
jgi:hypothetical protein